MSQPSTWPPGHLDGIIANSGCANAYTGPRGLEDARAMARLLAGFLGTDEKKIAVASTGVIGQVHGHGHHIQAF